MKKGEILGWKHGSKFCCLGEVSTITALLSYCGHSGETSVATNVQLQRCVHLTGSQNASFSGTESDYVTKRLVCGGWLG